MADKKSNILAIWGDDVGISNPSCSSQGLMGYGTPNIEGVAREGMLFTDSSEYATLTSNIYHARTPHNCCYVYAAQATAAKFGETFKDFPPIQPPNTFTIDDAIAKMASVGGSS